MVFGLTLKGDANFQTLDESCAFSFFDGNEASNPASNRPQELAAVKYISKRNLLSTEAELSDNLDDDSDSNMIGELMPYLNNLVRVASKDKESEPVSRTLLRAPSLDRDKETDESSNCSNSLDELEIRSCTEIMQLELPGIATVSTTGVNNSQNSLSTLLQSEGQEMKDHYQMNASIAFTTCFDHLPTEEDVVSMTEPIMLTMGSFSIEIAELESIGIVDMETVHKIRQYVLQNRKHESSIETATKSKSVDEIVRRRGRRRDSINQSNSFPSQPGDGNMENASESKPSSDCNNGHRQLEHSERPRSNYSSTDQKKIKGEKKVISDVTEMKNADTVLQNEKATVAKRRENPERRSSPNKRPNAGNKSSTVEGSPSKQINESLPPNKMKPRPTNANSESQKLPSNTNHLTSNVNRLPNRAKPVRSNSFNTVEPPNFADNEDGRSRRSSEHRRSDVGRTFHGVDASRKTDNRNGIEGHMSASRPKPVRSNSFGTVESARREDKKDDRRSSEHRRDNKNGIEDGDFSSPVSSKKQSIFGNTGKMIKYLSSRYLNQEKERPSLERAESQAICVSPRDHDNSFPDSKVAGATMESTEFKRHLANGTVPFTPQSNKRFLNWRAMGVRKSVIGNSSKHLIEGELDVVETETTAEKSKNEAANLLPPSSEFTVQNTHTAPANMDRESNKTPNAVQNVVEVDSQNRGTDSGRGKSTTQTHRERGSHNASSSHDQNIQKESKEKVSSSGKHRQSQSPEKSIRSTNKTPPKQSVCRTSVSHNHSGATKDTEREEIGSQNNPRSRPKKSDTNAAIQSTSSKEQSTATTDFVMDTRCSSPSKLRSSTSRGLSQSVHIHASPVKKLGKGSSTGVSRRQRLIASAVLDDVHSSLSNNVNNASSQESLKHPSDSTVDGKTVSPSDPVSQNHLSRSLHVSSPRKTVGNNTEIGTDVNFDMSFKSKTPSIVLSSIDPETGIDVTAKKGSNDSKQPTSTRARRTSCQEFKKELVAEPIEDEPVVVESASRGRRRSSIGFPLHHNATTN